DALIETDEMRRGVDMAAIARRLERGARERHDRALAVGARHMDDRRQLPLRVAEGLQKPLDARQREIDDARMQRGEAREQRVDGGHGTGASIICLPGRRNAPGTTIYESCSLNANPI